MIRGTTPTLTLTTDVDLSNAVALYVTFSQDHENVIEKNINEVKINGKSCDVILTQKDTLKLSAKQPCFVQIRGRTGDGIAFATWPLEKVEVNDILKDGVI